MVKFVQVKAPLSEFLPKYGGEEERMMAFENMVRQIENADSL
jgi:hypothetical protein